MKRVAFLTLGCKVNQYETQAMSELFEKHGYTVVDFHDFADIYVVNTCTVTNLSDKKSKQALRRAKRNNPDSVVAAVGCYSESHSNQACATLDVDIWIGNVGKENIVNLVELFLKNRQKINVVDNNKNYTNSTYELQSLKITKPRSRTRAYLKIQDGCNQFCSYCIIPYVRGPIQSKTPEKVLLEAQNLAVSGFKEIVLTGIHVSSYGKDLGNTSLMEIIHNINDIPSIERIRISSIEPLAINHNFIQTAKTLHKLCPHYHISLQSGCNTTLKRMNRKYTVKQYANIVNLLRNNIPNVSISTDIIVGFPGETEQEFLETYNFLKDINFSFIHVFKFSERKGTSAASMPDKVPAHIKNIRSQQVINLANSSRKMFNEKYVGQVLHVLFEQISSSNHSLIEGLTPNYIRVLLPHQNLQSLNGSIRLVKLLTVSGDHIIGELFTP